MMIRFRALAATACLLVAPLAAQAPRQLELKDLLGWKSVRSTVLSNDGKWIAFVTAPNEGDAQVTFRGTTAAATPQSAEIGELPAPAGGFGGGTPTVTIAGNSRWVAYLVYPKATEAKRLRRDRRPVVPKLVVQQLGGAAKFEFERVRAYRFAGDRSDWLAVQHAAPDAPAGGAAPAATTGSTLELINLNEGIPSTIAAVGEFAFDASGSWIAWTVDAPGAVGNGAQLRELSTGATRALVGEKAIFRRLTWADTGDALALLRGVADTAVGDTAWTVHGWAGVSGRAARAVRVDKGAKAVRSGLVVSGDRAPKWNDAQSLVLFGLRAARPPKPREQLVPVTGASAPAPGAGNAGITSAAPNDEDTPSLVLWHWKDPRLQSTQQVQENADKSASYLAAFHLSDSAVVQLGDEKLSTVLVAPKERWAVATDDSPYATRASMDGFQFRDVYAIDVRTGARRTIGTKVRNYGFGAGNAAVAFPPDGSRFTWYAEGKWLAYDFATGSTKELTAGAPTKFWDTEDDHNTPMPPAGAIGWSKDSRFFLARDDWDVWRLDVQGTAPVNLTGTGAKEKMRYQGLVAADPRAKGVDLALPLYFETYGEWTKKEGLARIDNARPGQPRMLAWEDARLDYRRAKDAHAWAFTRQSFTTFPDWYVTDADLANARRMSDANPQQKEVAWSPGAKLLTYACDHGDTVQAALFLPAGYAPGKRYPMVTYIYEKLSQTLNDYSIPSLTAYVNPSVYTSRGYAVLRPDITYKLDEPGQSAVRCVVPAVKAAIAAGVAEPGHIGLQGHSWGGYETAFITTQTDVFNTAIAGAPLTDMVSMFSSVYWNSGNANSSIFIASQGRFKSGFVQNPEAYLRNSPNRYAADLKIPLLLHHNDRDGAVDFNQGITYFNTLRELGKEVAMLTYVGENHNSTRPANRKDYMTRMEEWFDTFLRDKPAPDWIKSGVPRLQMEQHLRDRKKLVSMPSETPRPPARPAPVIP
ncbi:MAG: prolyl oligopeptidase family serine peptidase [Gemmatimonadaceae bacterium]|nr:prolyl oligopeptidase family serine peptidase [Gemmatimonadaceae bacterium]